MMVIIHLVCAIFSIWLVTYCWNYTDFMRTARARITVCATFWFVGACMQFGYMTALQRDLQYSTMSALLWPVYWLVRYGAWLAGAHT